MFKFDVPYEFAVMSSLSRIVSAADSVGLALTSPLTRVWHGSVRSSGDVLSGGRCGGCFRSVPMTDLGLGLEVEGAGFLRLWLGQCACGSVVWVGNLVVSEDSSAGVGGGRKGGRKGDRSSAKAVGVGSDGG